MSTAADSGADAGENMMATATVGVPAASEDKKLAVVDGDATTAANKDVTPAAGNNMIAAA